ncbi:MAG: Ig-like domain-containing protein [Candidatus Hydrogenedentota bacterium]
MKIFKLILILFFIVNVKAIYSAPWIGATWQEIYWSGGNGWNPGLSYDNYCMPWERVRVWVEFYDDLGSVTTPPAGQNSYCYINWSVNGSWQASEQNMTFDSQAGNNDNFQYVLPSFTPNATIKWYAHGEGTDGNDDKYTDGAGMDPADKIQFTIKDGGSDDNIQWDKVGHNPNLNNQWGITGLQRQPQQVFTDSTVKIYYREARDDADQIEFWYQYRTWYHYNGGSWSTSANTWSHVWDDSQYGYDIWYTQLTFSTPGIVNYHIHFRDDSDANDVYVYRNNASDTATTWGTLGTPPSGAPPEFYFRYVIEGIDASKYSCLANGTDSSTIYVYVADANGYPKSIENVTFSIISGQASFFGGDISDSVDQTDAHGFARVHIRSTIGGTVEIKATSTNFNATDSTVIITFGQYKRTIDGNKSDWFDTLPYIGNTAILATNKIDTEWVWRDKLYDETTVLGDGPTYDIRDIHIIADTYYLYFFVRADDLDNVNGANMFQFNVAMDTHINSNPEGGTLGLDWIGDESRSDGIQPSTLLGRTEQYSEKNIIMDIDGVYIYDYYNPGSGWVLSAASAVAINVNDNFMEARVSWSDLKFSKRPDRIRLTIATAKRIGGDPQTVDKTADIANSASDILDALSYGLYSTSTEWKDELSDGNIFSYIDIAFDFDGDALNPRLPSAPSNIRYYDSVFGIWRSSGDTILTNNPVITWNPVSPDGDSGDSILGYYIQISTSPNTDGNGFLQWQSNWVINSSQTGAGPVNTVVYHNNYLPQTSWTVPNGDGSENFILSLGQTYYLRIWARDRRGMLGAASQTVVIPIDYPIWHDPYTFYYKSWENSNETMRANREPKENADVNFSVGAYDVPPGDPQDHFYKVVDATNNVHTSHNEILNILLFIRVNRVGHATYDANWNNSYKVLVGDDEYYVDGSIKWYTPQSDASDTFNYWRTFGNIDYGNAWLYKYEGVNLGTGGTAGVRYLNANVGDTIEYFFEINNPYEAPGSNYLLTRAERRFLYAYDDNGITGYRIGAWSDAIKSPFRFVIQKRDLLACWHNPVSKEAVESTGSPTKYTMRSPAWPTAQGTVKFFAGVIGRKDAQFQLVWRKIGEAWQPPENFNAPPGIEEFTGSNKYYYRYDFNYTGGAIEYYIKLNDNSLFIFQNGITDNADTVYFNSIGDEGEASEPFKFPFESRVKVTSTGKIKDKTHSIVALFQYKKPPLSVFDFCALASEDTIDLRPGIVSITGDVLTNANPSAYFGPNDTPAAPQPGKLLGKSYPAIYTDTADVNGVRKAFFGPIYPFDYAVSDTSRWNTGSDVYKNIPQFTYDDVFKEITEKSISGNYTFDNTDPVDKLYYVSGDATVTDIPDNPDGAIVCDGNISVNIPLAISVDSGIFDLFALGGDITISGVIRIDTGVIFSNNNIILNSDADVEITGLGSIVCKKLIINQGSKLVINHPQNLKLSEIGQGTLAKTTNWFVGSMREVRR